MKVLVSGASGFVGTHLCRHLAQRGHTVMGLGRSPGSEFNWSESSLRAGVEAADGIINLAGENLFARRWSAKQKEILRSSRIESTRKLSELAVEFEKDFLITASAVGFYGPSDDAALTEEAGPGTDFLAQLCLAWEEAAALARESSVRVATVRIGVVLGADGGALKRMLLPFRLGLGGPVGHGRQGFPWIHIADLVGLFTFIMEQERASGLFNATAPQAVSMKEFASMLGKVLHRPALIPAPGFALRMLLGEVADVLLTGQRPLPRHALDLGYEFRFPGLEEALRDLT